MSINATTAPQGRILVVEDDPDAARFIVHVLRKLGGFEVSHTADPSAALVQVSSENWDLVITDVELPGMTGLDLLEELRQVAPALPVAVVTALVSADHAVTALRRRADAFLQKPLVPAVLIGTARDLIGVGRRAAPLAGTIAGSEVVLAIGAHPDDVEIGVGGTLLAHRAMGHQVSVLTLSRGGPGGPGGPGDPESDRAGESRKAAAILGAALYLEDLPDTRISEGDPTISVISRVIAAVQPTLIYAHSSHDTDPDHRSAHRAAMAAAREVGRVYCFQSPSATVDFGPTRFVTVDAHMMQKLSAIDAFASQAAVRTYLEPDMIGATARYWSRFGDGRYAEAFEVIRDRPADRPAARPAARPDRRSAPGATASAGQVSAPPPGLATAVTG